LLMNRYRAALEARMKTALILSGTEAERRLLMQCHARL
jgi:hypothetical protein